MRFHLIALSLLAMPAFAQQEARPTLPAGVVACGVIKDLQNYTTYTTTAPAFAKDLLDRAACFINETPQPAVKVGAQAGYVRYKLLSGHKVWVANEGSLAK